MRCPDCNKFVSLEMSDPEVNDLEVSDAGTVTASVRIIRCCADCGNELKEATLDLEEDVDIGEHHGEGHDISVDEDSVDQIEEGGGRYQKSYFGAAVNFTVTCSCNKDWNVSGVASDKVAASEMDELA